MSSSYKIFPTKMSFVFAGTETHANSAGLQIVQKKDRTQSGHFWI